MITRRADLTFDEVRNPSTRWCKSGHDIPDEMRVYSVGGPALPKSRWGTYCEACVAIARASANARKAKEQPQPQPEPEEPVSPALLKVQLRRVGFAGGIAEPEEETSKEPWEEFLEGQR